MTASVIREIVFLEHLGAVHVGQVRTDLTGRQTLRRERDHQLVDAGELALPLLHDLRLERPIPIPRYLDLDLATSVKSVFDRDPLRELPRSRPSTACLG